MDEAVLEAAVLVQKMQRRRTNLAAALEKLKVPTSFSGPSAEHSNERAVLL